jgi:hypothetical protein
MYILQSSIGKRCSLLQMQKNVNPRICIIKMTKESIDFPFTNLQNIAHTVSKICEPWLHSSLSMKARMLTF